MGHVCPWWHVYTFDNALRRLFYNPAAIFGPYVNPGDAVMDLGCGAGFNSIGLARIVGKKGRVFSVDLQQEMLNILHRRIKKTALADRIHTHRCQANSLGIEEMFDFINAFWMVHEVPDIREFLRQVHSTLRPKGKFLVAEPRFHVSARDFQKMILTAQEVGFTICNQPHIAFSRVVVFSKT